MSTAVDRLTLRAAVALAEKIRQALQPGCDRIEIAGSIRRREQAVGDIELVAIPARQPGLFGQPATSLLDGVLRELVAADRLIPGRCDGDRYKQFEIPARPGLMLDLFLVTRETWGVQMAIRTGPAAFSRRLVTEESFGGLLPDGHRVHDGRLWGLASDVQQAKASGRDLWRETPDSPLYQAFDTPREIDFFEHLPCGWIEPEERR